MFEKLLERILGRERARKFDISFDLLSGCKDEVTFKLHEEC